MRSWPRGSPGITPRCATSRGTASPSLRICAGAELVGSSGASLALSPQCGFASVAVRNLLTLDQQWRKLELVADTARTVWDPRSPGL